jgi:hypothetical protein
MDEEECEDDELDDLLEEQWNLQDQIHKKCKIKDNPEDKIKKWKEKYS